MRKRRVETLSKNRFYLLLVILLFLSCICLAQSGRQLPKTTNPKVAGPQTKSTIDGQAKIPLWVALSRQRRLVMLPQSNQFYAEQIVKSLKMVDGLTIEFDPQKLKVEDAQVLLRTKPGTYLLLLRFEELKDRDESKSCGATDPKWVTSYKMDYTLLAPEGRMLKRRSIQTFFSCARNVKPLFELFVKNCVNRSRSALDDSAVQCMTQHVLNDLYNLQRVGAPTR